MAKSVKLLLVENVESLGIVGDVVNVRTGYARNYLLPRSLATAPSDDLVKQLAGKRAEAERQVAAMRKDREQLAGKLQGVEIELIRSCNDLGILYGAVTQQDIAGALNAKGYKVSPRDVRITQTIKRVDHFDVHVKLDRDLDSIVKLHVKPDRELPKDRGQSAGEETQAAGLPGEAGMPKRRDALSLALEEASKSTEKTGWGGGDKKSAAADSEGKASKKGDKADKGEKKEKPEKKDKAEKPAKKK
ncbi:MAG TPA: 50S ribosomal protein L9 [Phycisphaerales bacterium]|nr:50S ribosomal protein L9 [Phycisphaerales bacterium]